METKRPYRSATRNARALETRLRIRDAARASFATTGFAGTTVPAIATRAGVAVQTVYAVFGSKGAIVRSMLEAMEEGFEDGVEDAIGREPDAHVQLEMIVKAIVGMFSQSRDILGASRDAVGVPEVAELIKAGDERRLMGCEGFVSRWSARGALRPGVTVAAARDRFWLMTGTQQYLLATERLGWQDVTYIEWLVSTLDEALFDTNATQDQNEDR